MSVLIECQPGDTFFCLQEFHASPDGEGFSWDTCRRFRVGEKLRFVFGREKDDTLKRPTNWHVVFDAADRKRYAATQTYFVTAECWERLKGHFTRRQHKQHGAKMYGSHQIEEEGANGLYCKEASHCLRTDEFGDQVPVIHLWE